MKKLFFLAAVLWMSVAALGQDVIVKNDGTVINAYRTDYSGAYPMTAIETVA